MKLVALCVLAACSGESGVSVIMHATDAPPAYGTTPFPTDAVKDGDTLGPIAGIDKLIAHHADLVTAHVAALDGFGVRPLVEFFVDGAIDPDTIEGNATLVDIDPASPDRGAEIAMDWHYDADRAVIQGAPTSGAVLRDGTRYAAYITTAIQDTRGRALHRASALGHLTAARWRTTGDALAELPDNVAGVAVFTTQHATAPLLAARSALDAAPPPQLAFPNPAVIFSGKDRLDRVLGHAARFTDGPRAGTEHWGNDNPTGMAHDHVGVIGTGTITIVRFRRDDTGTDGPEDETFDLGADGTPRIVAIEPIPITFILPAAAPPATGYPVVIYGHGLGAGRDQLLSFAEPLTAQGYAVVGIDAFGHGSRYNPIDVVDNLRDQLAMFDGDPTLPDGFGDVTGLTTTFDFFEGFMNVAAVRDAMRQTALDLSRVVQLLRRPDLDLTALAANAHLDTRHIAYLGESFGTVVGTVFAAIEPNVDLYVLDVPGGGILDLLLPTSADIGALAMPLIETLYNPATRLDRWNPLIGFMQAVIDGADPLTYAPHVLRDRFPTIGARSVVCLEVMGDQTLSNRGTEALARGLGLDVLTPDLAAPAGLAEIPSPAAGNRDGKTAILVQYSPATHGANWSNEHGVLKYYPNFPSDNPDDPFPLLPQPITIANPIYETLAQVTEILGTHQAGNPPLVRSTKAPVADFDGDGVPDSQDAAPYDPKVH